MDPGCAAGWSRHGSAILASGAAVHAYRLPRAQGGYETFHAKFVLADDSLAYVGSANFLQSGLDRSLECGILMPLPGARELARVADAMIRIGQRIG